MERSITFGALQGKLGLTAQDNQGEQILSLPSDLKPYFQEYDLDSLNLDRDANLVMQRVLEYGDWDEVRWLFRTYGGDRIRAFVAERGERLLSRVAFNYWRKLLDVHDWRPTPFPTAKGEVWDR